MNIGSNPRQGKRFRLFSKTSTLTIKLTQSPIQLLPGGGGVKRPARVVDHSLLSGAQVMNE
jgi:hypothetical protein